MPSAFALAFAVGIDASYGAVGDPAVYTDSEGWNHNCTAIVNRDLTEYGDAPGVQGATAVISVRKSEVPARPKRGDTFTVEGCDPFSVDSVLSSDDFEHRVIVL